MWGDRLANPTRQAGTFMRGLIDSQMQPATTTPAVAPAAPVANAPINAFNPNPVMPAPVAPTMQAQPAVTPTGTIAQPQQNQFFSDYLKSYQDFNAASSTPFGTTRRGDPISPTGQIIAISDPDSGLITGYQFAGDPDSGGALPIDQKLYKYLSSSSDNDGFTSYSFNYDQYKQDQQALAPKILFDATQLPLYAQYKSLEDRLANARDLAEKQTDEGGQKIVGNMYDIEAQQIRGELAKFRAANPTFDPNKVGENLKAALPEIATDNAKIQSFYEDSLKYLNNIQPTSGGRLDSSANKNLLLFAIATGQDISAKYGGTYGAAVQLKQDLGQYAGKDVSMIIPANPVGYSGGFRFDPTYGSTVYKDLAMQLGEQLGLSKDEIGLVAGKLAIESFYSPGNTKAIIGFAPYGKMLTDRLLEATDAPLTEDQKKKVYDAVTKVDQQFRAGAAVESQSSGFFKGLAQDLGAALGPIDDIIVTAIGGPLAGAIYSGVTTGLATGSFSDGLKAGAISFAGNKLGTSISPSISSGLSSVGVNNGLINSALTTGLTNATVSGVTAGLSGGDFKEAVRKGLLGGTVTGLIAGVAQGGTPAGQEAAIEFSTNEGAYSGFDGPAADAAVNRIDSNIEAVRRYYGLPSTMSTDDIVARIGLKGAIQILDFALSDNGSAPVSQGSSSGETGQPSDSGQSAAPTDSVQAFTPGSSSAAVDSATTITRAGTAVAPLSRNSKAARLSIDGLLTKYKINL